MVGLVFIKLFLELFSTVDFNIIPFLYNVITISLDDTHVMHQHSEGTTSLYGGYCKVIHLAKEVRQLPINVAWFMVRYVPQCSLLVVGNAQSTTT